MTSQLCLNVAEVTQILDIVGPRMGVGSFPGDVDVSHSKTKFSVADSLQADSRVDELSSGCPRACLWGSGCHGSGGRESEPSFRILVSDELQRLVRMMKQFRDANFIQGDATEPLAGLSCSSVCLRFPCLSV
jgi:hypothetical protein